MQHLNFSRCFAINRLLLVLPALLIFSACSFSSSHVRIKGTEVLHTVQLGETLESIGSRYGVSPQELILLNDLRGPRALRVGGKILVGYSADYVPRDHLAAEAFELKTASLRGSPAVPQRPHLLWPVAAARISSSFGPRKKRFHDGIDFSAKAGTPVRSAHDGVIEYAGRELNGYGKTVIVRGDDRLFTVYAHNRKLLVKRGQRVQRGQLIAEVGSTGHSTGPHLHFEVRLRDAKGRFVSVDPMPLLERSDERPRFRVNESLTPLLARLGE